MHYFVMDVFLVVMFVVVVIGVGLSHEIVSTAIAIAVLNMAGPLPSVFGNFKLSGFIAASHRLRWQGWEMAARMLTGR